MSKRVVSFHYTLTDKTGQTIDSSAGRSPLSYIEGTGSIIPGLERQLSLLSVGDKRKISVAAAEAYGLRDETKLVKVPRSAIPAADVKVGDRFTGGEGEHAPVFVVTECAETEITLDGNHPLAGLDLTFDIELTGTRPATAEELSHGHAHGEHGHSHG